MNVEAEEEVLIAPAEPLDRTQLETVNFHKLLTECWQRNAQPKLGATPRVPCPDYGFPDHAPSALRDEADLDAQLKAFLEERDAALIPEELMYTNKVALASQRVDNKRFRQKLTDRLKKIEMRERENGPEKVEREARTDESEGEGPRGRGPGEGGPNELEDSVGDYKYSFCEEELDEESEYY